MSTAPVDTASEPASAPPSRPARRRVRIVALVALVVLVPVLVVVALLFERQHAYDRNIDRMSGVFPAESGRPAARPGRAETWLLVGSDRRADAGTTGTDADEPVWRFGSQRADTIMLVHLPAERDRVYLTSFPRDSWVRVPGHGTAKINAAFSFGGPPLLVSTLERLTRARIDHVAILDFEGFESMTDALGGVDVTVAETVRDPARDVVWKAGTHHLDGAQALNFVRHRYNLPGGDFDRIKRQQAFLKALAGQVAGRDTLGNPLRLNAFLEAATGATSVDASVRLADLRSLAIGFRSLRADDIVFMTAPVAGTGDEGGQSVVYLDRERSRSLYRALRSDSLDEYVAAGGAVNTVDEVR